MKYFSIKVSIILLSLFVMDSGYAAAVRRSAVVVQGPAGGIAVGASRTAIVRPGFRMLSNRDAGEKASMLAKTPTEKSCELDMKALRTSH